MTGDGEGDADILGVWVVVSRDQHATQDDAEVYRSEADAMARADELRRRVMVQWVRVIDV